MFKPNYTLLNGIYFCESKYPDCFHNCYFCIDKLDINRIKLYWEYFLESVSKNYVSILNKINFKQFETLINYKYAIINNPLSVIEPSDEYFDISKLYNKYDTVIDFGCGNGIQCLIFDKFDKYIGIDHFFSAPIKSNNSKFFLCDAKEYIINNIQNIDQENTIVISYYLPDNEIKKLIKNNFKHNSVI